MNNGYLEYLIHFGVEKTLVLNVLSIKFVQQNVALHQCLRKRCFLHGQKMQNKRINDLYCKKKKKKKYQIN